MANNVGNISVGLTLSNSDFAVKLDQSVAKVAATSKQMAAVASVGGKQFGSGFGQGLTQAAFALDDFQTVLSMGGGMQRAIMSAGNNLTAMAAAGGPAAIILTAIGVAATSKLVPALMKSNDQIKTASENMKVFEADTNAALRTIDRMSGLQRKGQNGGLNALSEQRGRFDDLASIDRQAEFLRRQRQAIERETAYATKFGSSGTLGNRVLQGLGEFGDSINPFGQSGASAIRQTLDRRKQELLENERLLSDLRGRRLNAENEVAALEKRRNEDVARQRFLSQERYENMIKDQREQGHRQFISQFGTFAQKRDLQIEGLAKLRKPGAISQKEYDQGVAKLNEVRQPSSLPAITVGSQEQMAMLNRAIRGGDSQNQVVKNTADNVKATKNVADEVRKGYQNASKIKVVTF